MPIQIHQITLTKAQLLKLPEQERNLFVSLGHAANEVSVLSKMFHFCSGNAPSEPILAKAHNAQALLMGRLLTGKIYEFWNLLREGYFARGIFRSALSQTYNGLLDDETRNALGEMKGYFGKANNVISCVRNGHAFHYDVKQIEDGFAAVVDDESLEIYLAEANANSLYGFADIIAGRAMLEAICPGDPKRALDLLISETARAVGWINVVIGGLMMTCLKRYLGDNFYDLDATVVTLEGFPNSQEVTIPFFIEIGVGGNAST